MVEDDAVVVVDQLSLVAELDRFPEPALSDRPGVGIVQADLPRCTVWDLAGEPFSGLLGGCQIVCVSDPEGRVST